MKKSPVEIEMNERGQKVIRTSFIRSLVYDHYMTKKEINKAYELTNPDIKLLWSHPDLKDVKDQKMPNIHIISDLSDTQVQTVKEEIDVKKELLENKHGKIESKELFDNISDSLIKEGEKQTIITNKNEEEHERKLEEAFEEEKIKDDFAVEEDRFKATQDKDGIEEDIHSDEEVDDGEDSVDW